MPRPFTSQYGAMFSCVQWSWRRHSTFCGVLVSSRKCWTLQKMPCLPLSCAVRVHALWIYLREYLMIFCESFCIALCFTGNDFWFNCAKHDLKCSTNVNRLTFGFELHRIKNVIGSVRDFLNPAVSSICISSCQFYLHISSFSWYCIN